MFLLLERALLSTYSGDAVGLVSGLHSDVRGMSVGNKDTTWSVKERELADT